jgi:low temperature requirement protein LtrA
MHRFAEWIMLMLGESVFSILIVYVPDKGHDFYTTFYCSLLTTVLLQRLHFKSQPDRAEHHASRRNKNAGIVWILLQQVYSLALISLGAAFTFFLTLFTPGEERRLEERMLAGDPYISDDLQTRGAHMFSGALAIIFFSLDAMIILHLGIKESQHRCVCKHTNAKNVKGIILLAFRFGLLVLTATLSQWEQEPDRLAMIGLALVLVQLLLRRLGGKYLSHNQVHALDSQSSAH